MKFKSDFLRNYISHAPLALAYERSLECELYLPLEFERPILDLGCGEGLFAEILFAEPIESGLDPDPDELELAEGMYEEKLLTTGDNIPKPDNHYKTVFSNSVLEHIADLEPVLDEVYRVLDKGGRFYFTVPSNNFDQYAVINQMLMAVGLKSLADRYRRFYNSFWKHYHYYSLEEWKKLVMKSGFEVDDMFTYNPKPVCMTNDFLTYMAASAKLIKLMTGRWVLSPALRRVFMFPQYLLGKKLLNGATRSDNGALVFMSLRKS